MQIIQLKDEDPLDSTKWIPVGDSLLDWVVDIVTGYGWIQKYWDNGGGGDNSYDYKGTFGLNDTGIIYILWQVSSYHTYTYDSFGIDLNGRHFTVDHNGTDFEFYADFIPSVTAQGVTNSDNWFDVGFKIDLTTGNVYAVYTDRGLKEMDFPTLNTSFDYEYLMGTISFTFPITYNNYWIYLSAYDFGNSYIRYSWIWGDTSQKVFVFENEDVHDTNYWEISTYYYRPDIVSDGWEQKAQSTYEIKLLKTIDISNETEFYILFQQKINYVNTANFETIVFYLDSFQYRIQVAQNSTYYNYSRDSGDGSDNGTYGSILHNPPSLTTNDVYTFGFHFRSDNTIHAVQTIHSGTTIPSSFTYDEPFEGINVNGTIYYPSWQSMTTFQNLQFIFNTSDYDDYPVNYYNIFLPGIGSGTGEPSGYPIITYDSCSINGNSVSLSPISTVFSGASIGNTDLNTEIYAVSGTLYEKSSSTSETIQFNFILDAGSGSESATISPLVSGFTSGTNRRYINYDWINNGFIMNTWNSGITSGTMIVHNDSGYAGLGVIQTITPDGLANQWSPPFGSSNDSVMDVPTIYQGTFTAMIQPPSTWEQDYRLHDFKIVQIHTGFAVDIYSWENILSGTIENNTMNIFIEKYDYATKLRFKLFHYYPKSWRLMMSGAIVASGVISDNITYSGTTMTYHNNWEITPDILIGYPSNDLNLTLETYGSGLVSTPLRTIDINIITDDSIYVEGFGISEFGRSQFGG